MTVSAQTTVNSSTGNGATTVFPYTFKILTSADLEVLVDGVVKTLTTHYTVSGAGTNGGGDVTFLSAPASGAIVVRRRNMQFLRSADYQYQGDLPNTVLNPDLDAPILMAQQLQEQIGRSVRGPAGEAFDELPAAADRAGLFLAFDNDGAPYPATSVASTGVSAFMTTVLDDTTAAAARTTLGAAASGNNTDIDGLDMVNALAPATLLPSGAAGENADRLTVTRASGYGTYGARLTTFQITDATPAGEFDVGDTSWVTQTNLTGGQVFGGWHGANTPAAALGQTYSGGAAIGQELNVGNRWADFGLQTAPGGTRYTVGQNIVPDVLPAADGVNSTNLTSISIANPGVFTWPSTHGFTAGMGIVFGGTGTMPGGITAGTKYYILSSGLTATQFQVSDTPGGTAVQTTGSFVAPIYGLPSWPGSFGQVIGKSVHGHRWWVGNDIPPDSIMPGGWAHYESGGSVASQGPLGWAAVTGYWTYGIDFGAGIFATSPINFSFSNTHVNTATAGGQTLPANPQGFLKLTMSGSAIRVPYYNA